MNSCLYEGFATLWMYFRGKFIPSIQASDIDTAQDSLHHCKNSLMQKERELNECIKKAHQEALLFKKRNDLPRAHSKLQERKRYQARLEKVTNSLCIVDKQIDTLQNSELDKALLHSLKLSNNIMKKAGISVNATEVEHIMNELDTQIHESVELNQVLATPLQFNEMDLYSAGMSEELLEAELNAELSADLENENAPASHVTVETESLIDIPLPPAAQSLIPDTLSRQKGRDKKKNSQYTVLHPVNEHLLAE